MSRWLAEPFSGEEYTAHGGEREVPCFRIFPEGEPDRWIAQTNPSLPLHVQEEVALLIADALSKVLGV
jgi:hypothetical protein